jgi:hypothetical protein
LSGTPLSQNGSGESFLIDLRGAEVVKGEVRMTPAVALMLFQKLEAVQNLLRRGKRAELVLVHDGEGMDYRPDQVRRIFESLLHRAGPAGAEALRSGLLSDRRFTGRSVNIHGRDAGSLLHSLVEAERKGGMDVQVVTDAAGEAWWRGLDLPAAAVMVAAVKDLADVEVSMTLSGSMAVYFEFWLDGQPSSVREAAEKFRRPDGTVRFDPVEFKAVKRLESDQQKLTLYDLQA